MKRIICEKLKTIERQFNVRILYACESGSRAWGFASQDSDYDVRFIYAHKMDDYLSIDEQRDVIELPINDMLDINGWELRKALRLFRRSNVALYEWLQSPIVYVQNEALVQDLKLLMSVYFSARAGIHHYLSMAKGVFKDELSGEKVRLKKYFYALRPVLAATWIAHVKSVPPMDFISLRKLMPKPFESIINDLLVLKANADEKFVINKCSELNTFIDERIQGCECLVPEASQPTDYIRLNELFRKYIV